MLHQVLDGIISHLLSTGAGREAQPELSSEGLYQESSVDTNLSELPYIGPKRWRQAQQHFGKGLRPANKVKIL